VGVVAQQGREYLTRDTAAARLCRGFSSSSAASIVVRRLDSMQAPGAPPAPRDTCVVRFCGATVHVPLGEFTSDTGSSADAAEVAVDDAAPDDIDDTGRYPWEASALVLRLLSAGDFLERLDCASPAHLRLLDVSAGVGAVGLAVAAAGAAHVVLTDLPRCAARLAAVARALLPGAAAAGAVRALPLPWGDARALARVADAGPFDLAVVCDVLYVAQRACGVALGGAPGEAGAPAAAALRATLAALLRSGTARAVLFVFETRSAAREAAFVRALADGEANASGGCGGGADAAAVARVCVEELAVAPLSEGETLAASGGCRTNGDARTETWTPALFWEPPPLRALLLRPDCTPALAPGAACGRCGGGGGGSSGGGGHSGAREA
jgi:hypothetical protein